MSFRPWLVLAVVGCSDAPQTTTGGGARYDAAVSSGSDGGAVSAATWGDLYRDFFGPRGKASCAGDGQCHGAADQPGAKASNYVCAPDAGGCYQGMTNAKLIVPGDASKAPEQTSLYIILRKSDGTGIMPKRPPSVVFSPDDMARIAAWLRRGAPLDFPEPSP